MAIFSIDSPSRAEHYRKVVANPLVPEGPRKVFFGGRRGIEALRAAPLAVNESAANMGQEKRGVDCG